MPDALHFTGDPEADAFLAEDSLALLVGFVLDQHRSGQLVQLTHHRRR
jgi:hypothetical protein